MPGATLSLRPLRPGDEPALRRAHRAMADEGFTFALGYDEGMAFDDYLDQLERRRRGTETARDRTPADLPRHLEPWPQMPRQDSRGLTPR